MSTYQLIQQTATHGTQDTVHATAITNMNSLVAETPWHLFASNCTLDNSD